MASVANNVELLQRQNKQLKDELARLQHLAQEMEKRGVVGPLKGKPTELKQEDEKVVTLKNDKDVRRAFDFFDTDKSGFISREELAGLANSLGAVLDDEELTDAMKAIDVSGDGKISYNEFFRWWTLPETSFQAKSSGKMVFLRTRLIANYALSGVPSLVRRLSEQKPPSDTASEWSEHKVALKLGEFKDPGAFFDVEVKFSNDVNFGNFKDTAGTTATVVGQAVLVAKPGLTADKQQEITTALKEYLAEDDSSFETSIRFDGDKCIIEKGSVKQTDPTALAQQLGMDLTKFVRKCRMRLELGKSVSFLIDPHQHDGQTTLADCLQMRFNLDFQFHKSLAHTLGDIAPVNRIGALLEKTNLELSLGSVKELLDVVDSGEGIDEVAQLERVQAAQIDQFRALGMSEADLAQIQAQQQMALEIVREQQQAGEGGGVPGLPPFLQPHFWLSQDFQGTLRGMYDELCATQLAAASSPATVAKINLLRSYFVEPVKLSINFASGFNVTMELKDMIPFQFLPQLEVNADGRAVVAAAQGEA